MNVRLDRNQFGQRYQGFGRDNYVFIYNIMKAMTCANAMLALYFIVSNITDGHTSFALRLPFWLASFAAMMMTYSAMSTGMLIIAHQLSVRDIWVPFVKMVLESCLFLVLAVGSKPDSTLWYHWYLVFGLFAATSHIKLRHIRSKLRSEFYTDGFEEVLEIYREGIRKDIAGSGINAALWLIIWAVLNFILFPYYPAFQSWHFVLGFFAFGIMVMVMRDTQKMRERLHSHVEIMS